MWDERFNVEHYIYGTAPNKFLEENVKFIPKGAVLCLAEGEGRNAVFLAKQGYHVTAVDSSLVGLEKAKKLAKDNNVVIECVHADLEEYNIGEDRWSGIISIFCPVPELLREKLHKKVVAGLKKNGVLLLEAYTPEQLKHGTGGGNSAALMMSKKALNLELAGLTFSRIEELERDVVEGTHHTGIGAVVQVIATK